MGSVLFYAVEILFSENGLCIMFYMAEILFSENGVVEFYVAEI